MKILENLVKVVFETLSLVNENSSEKESTSIQLSKNALNDEEKKCKEIADRTIKTAENSGFFKTEFMPILTEKIRDISKVGYGYEDPFDKTDCLTLEEKKALKLNTRKKYAREFINGLTEKGIAEASEKDFLQNMFLQNFHQVSREYDLKRMKADGIKYVEILDCGDERDCKAIKRLKKHYPIDEVPELPLPQCKADYCRCSFIADQKELMK